MMKREPENITVCNLECIVMPNGEVLCAGERIGWIKKLGRYLTVIDKEKPAKEPA
jgi:hypothetical protein